MKRKAFSAILACSFLAPIFAFVGALVHDGATLTVHNSSRNRLEGVTVELIGYGTKHLGNIEPGEKARARFHRYGDSCWVLDVDSHTGIPFREQAGYLTNGMNFDDRITISDGSTARFDSTDWILVPPVRTLLRW